jgi:hypothetical protein
MASAPPVKVAGFAPRFTFLLIDLSACRLYLLVDLEGERPHGCNLARHTTLKFLTP